MFFLGVARPPLGPRATCGGPMGPLINYREERASARDEREVFISWKGSNISPVYGSLKFARFEGRN